MPAFDPTVSENIRSLQRQVNRLGTAPVGPTSIGPGEGPFRFYTDDGDTALLSADGVRVRFRGALTGVSPLMEQHQTTIDSHGSRLGTAEGSIAGHGTRLTAAETNILAQAGQINGALTRLGSVESKNSSQDTWIDSHSTRLGAAESRLGAVESKNASQDVWIDSYGNRISATESKNQSQDSAIGVAQARADAAYQLANGRATKAEVAAAEDKAENARLQALSVQNALISWINAARNEIPGLPPPPDF